MAITVDGVASATAAGVAAAQNVLPQTLQTHFTWNAVAGTTATATRYAQTVDPGPGPYQPLNTADPGHPSYVAP
jgi:hypothetical protein